MFVNTSKDEKDTQHLHFWTSLTNNSHKIVSANILNPISDRQTAAAEED